MHRVGDMLLLVPSTIVSASSQPGFSAKMVFNKNGALIFPATQQHREMKAENISYDDNYKGNALAAMLSRGLIEIRFHKSFSDAAVARLVSSLLQTPEMAFMKGWRVTYQGRPISFPM